MKLLTISIVFQTIKLLLDDENEIKILDAIGGICILGIVIEMLSTILDHIKTIFSGG